jgi:hypothetical protein
MFPDVSAVIDGRGFPILTQYFCLPTLSKVSELRCWHWPVADFVDVGDLVFERTLSQSFRWIILFRTDCRLASNTLDSALVNNIFPSPSVPNGSGVAKPVLKLSRPRDDG